MGCLDENILSEYLRRALPEGEQARAEDHLRACADCRQLVAGMAEAFGGGSQPVAGVDAHDERRRASPVDAPPGLLAGGTSVGRYVILRPIGAGGFGIVYAAYDPKLDRKIAVKLVRADRIGLEPGAQDRLLREAQAMARLVHPNVTAVYDVAARGKQISIAMEFVEGANARDWLREKPRTWREILEVFTQAGRGLAAAHDARLVHRDFKPANVLIGRDGRASVTDFGMARRDRAIADRSTANPGPAQVPPTTDDRPRSAAAADTKGLIGTPAYMSPEQHQGRPATAQSDQFSFCVALHESLFGQHPFLAETPADLPSAVIEGKRRPLASRSQVPSWLAQAINRGLERDPARRFGSMNELLGAISWEPRRRRRRQLLAVAAACLVSAIPLARVYDLRRQRAGLCTGASAQVADVWSLGQKEKVRAAFLANGGRFGEDAWARAEGALDSYLASWAAMFTGACEATRLRGEQSDEVLTARMLCLDRRLAEVRSMVNELAAADEQLVINAIASISALSDLSECRNVQSLLTQVPPPAGARAAVEDVRGKLAEVKALRSAGRLERARALTDDAVQKAKHLDYAPLTAEALLLLGRGQALQGDRPRAEQTLLEALRAAGKGRHDLIAAETWVELVFLVGALDRRDVVGLEWRHAALAAIERMGGDKALEAKLASAVGLILAYRGRYQEALEQHRRSLRLIEDALGPDAPQLGPQLHRVAEVLRELGRYQESARMARQSMAQIERTYGPRHPILALPLQLIAEHACVEGEYQDCAARIEEAMAIRTTSSTPPDHPTFILMRALLARSLSGLRRGAEAEQQLDAALKSAMKTYGPSDALTGSILSAMGEVLARNGKAQVGVEKSKKGLAVVIEAFGAEHPDVAAARDSLGETLRMLGHHREALIEHQQALALRENMFGRESPLLAASLIGIAECHRALGRRGEAIEIVERAVELGPNAGNERLAQARFLLARLLIDTRRNPERARELAALARNHWRAVKPPR